MSWVHRCMIVPTEHVGLARVLCETLAGPGGAGMFTTALSPTGTEPATHWISAGLISAEFASLLPLTTFPIDAEPIYTPGNPEVVAQMAQANGMQTTAEEVQALYDVSDITDEDAFSAMARLGLQIVQLPLDQTK